MQPSRRHEIGGHTGEMLSIVKDLPRRYSPIQLVIAHSDSTSLPVAKTTLQSVRVNASLQQFSTAHDAITLLHR